MHDPSLLRFSPPAYPSLWTRWFLVRQFFSSSRQTEPAERWMGWMGSDGALQVRTSFFCVSFFFFFFSFSFFFLLLHFPWLPSRVLASRGLAPHTLPTTYRKHPALWLDETGYYFAAHNLKLLHRRKTEVRETETKVERIGENGTASCGEGNQVLVDGGVWTGRARAMVIWPEER